MARTWLIYVDDIQSIWNPRGPRGTGNPNWKSELRLCVLNIHENAA